MTPPRAPAPDPSPPQPSFLLERSVLINARSETVFRYFTDSTRFASWWGAGSRIEPRPGGTVFLQYPNGMIASGAVVELIPDTRLVFSYGYRGDNPMIPPGGSRVTGQAAELRGGNLFEFAPDGLIARVVGLWSPG